jgi:hypothetical protein
MRTPSWMSNRRYGPVAMLVGERVVNTNRLNDRLIRNHAVNVLYALRNVVVESLGEVIGLRVLVDILSTGAITGSVGSGIAAVAKELDSIAFVKKGYAAILDGCGLAGKFFYFLYCFFEDHLVFILHWFFILLTQNKQFISSTPI